ncbi:nucleolar protein 5 [Paraphysoderma sedebokerense]|nr:nucleolar protein 5 [Paraphysoderma sedebokerense]
MVLVLFETAAGYALFKLLDDGKLEKPDDIYTHFQNAEVANKTVKLTAFSKFDNTADALSAATALVEGKVSKSLKKFLQAELSSSSTPSSLIVADSKLGSAIAKKLSLNVLPVTSAVNELYRGIRSQLESLIQGLPAKDMANMALGLSHSLSRYKLKFSPDKVDTMIVQAIGLLDDLDKELNTYAMRVKEWYGWHFPEMTKIIVDNLAYAKVVVKMGFRTNAATTDLSDILPEDLEQTLKDAATISMGTEISDVDLINIRHLAEQVISLQSYRTQLYSYLSSRMQAIAPNLTALVGELVGARLIAHAGSLMTLAKHPASTVQILGAEKALFRALKTKKDTPKYGLIYHAGLVGMANGKNKGKIARMLATKASISIRCDALGDKDTPSDVGSDARTAIESRIRELEARGVQGGRISGTGYNKNQKKFEMNTVKSYNAGSDMKMNGSTPSKKRKIEEVETSPAKAAESEEEVAKKPKLESDEKKSKKEKKSKSSKKEKKSKDEESAEVETESPKKEKKEKKSKDKKEKSEKKEKKKKEKSSA